MTTVEGVRVVTIYDTTERNDLKIDDHGTI
jgi:hypothetical protein